MPTVDVNGLSMYYEVRGDGPPLVLILGLALDLSEVEPVVAGLAERFRVLAFDNRGAGRTASPPGPYTIPQMADDTVGLMDSVGVAAARVVGISMGARIGLDVAIRHPERVTDLVLIGAQYRSRAKVTTSLPMKLMAPLRWLPIGPGKYPQARAAFEAQRHATTSYDCTDDLARISARTLILHGERDRTAPVSQAVEMARRIPDAGIRTFRGGHLFFLFSSGPDVLRAIREF